MNQKRNHEEVKSRNEPFVEKVSTRIWHEVPSEDNPYIAAGASCYGYDIFELAEKRSFVDVFFLLFKGELPTKEQASLLESLMILLINPGPRHEATRAAMNAGVGKTETTHILSIGAAVLGGKYLGAGAVEASMRFLRKQQRKPATEFYDSLVPDLKSITETESAHNFFYNRVPGFGSINGGVDVLTNKIANHLVSMPAAGNSLKWGNELATKMRKNGYGWLANGVASAAFADLGFQPRFGASLFQMICSPGLIAHGVELANKPITSMPYVKDEDYVIKR